MWNTGDSPSKDSYWVSPLWPRICRIWCSGASAEGRLPRTAQGRSTQNVGAQQLGLQHYHGQSSSRLGLNKICEEITKILYMYRVNIQS